MKATGVVATSIAMLMSATGCSAFLAAAPGSLLCRAAAAGGVSSSSACLQRPLGRIGLGDGLKRRARPVSQAAGGLLAARASAVEMWSFAGAEASGVFRAGNGMAGDEVLTIRHDSLGTCLELWHGSYGWFDYAPAEGASLMLCDNWAVTLPRINKGFANLRQTNDLRASATRGDGKFKLTDEIKAGTWTVKAAAGGKAVFVTNAYSPRQQLILTEDGFVFIGSKGKAILVEAGGGEVQMKTEEALGLPALAGL
ncbi:hypothetical protein T484DRAFT_2761348 [Baffinella frigidus]|nr:hypothetical protein T484DRAFT_2761348 [Cryptophyta sp. CCMP2293]